MTNIKYFYSLNIKWLQNFAEEIGAEVQENRMITIPNTFGEGKIFFTQIAPGMAAVYKDFIVSKDVKMTKLKTDENFFIFNYTLLKDEELGHTTNFSIIGDEVENVCETLVNERVKGLSLLIDKKVMKQLIKEIPHSEAVNKKLQNGNIYRGYIDVDSLILIYSLNKKSRNDSSFDNWIRGVSYMVLANFLNKTNY